MTTIRMEDLQRLKCAACGQKPALSQRTAKLGAIFVGECKCKIRIFWVDKTDYDAWRLSGGKNGQR